MQNETARLIRLVNENLDYEKIRTNQIQIVVKKFNGTEALENQFNRILFLIFRNSIILQSL
jgi:signal transduction histidine kinase